MGEQAKETRPKKKKGVRKFVKTASNGLARMPSKTAHIVNKDEDCFKNLFLKARLLLYRCQH